MQFTLDSLHLVLHLVRQMQDASCRLCINIHIYRIQSIHTIKARRLISLDMNPSQIIEINHPIAINLDGNISKLLSIACRFQSKSNPLLPVVRSGMLHRANHLILSQEIADSILQVLACNATSSKCHRVIAHLHILIRGSCHLYPVHAIHQLQASHHISSDKLLQHLGWHITIDLISEQQLLLLVHSRTTGYLATFHHRIASTLGQLGIRLAQQRSNRESQSRNIHLFLCPNNNLAAAIGRAGGNTLHPFQRRDHSLYRCRQILLYNLSRHLWPFAPDDQTIIPLVLRLGAHIHQRQQSRTHYHQDDKGQYHRE